VSSHLLAMSFDTGSSPSITLKAGRDKSLDAPAGWGFAWYPMDDAAATVVKDPNATHETPLTRVLRDWDRFRSSVFLCHSHGAAKRVTQQDTHPFQRSWAGRDWIFAHSGDLGRDLPEKLPLGEDAWFEPVGRTDSEHAFCWLLGQIRESGARTLGEVGWERLHAWLRELNDLGKPLTEGGAPTSNGSFVLSDGHDVVAYCDARGKHPFHRIRRVPPHERYVLVGEQLVVDVSSPYDVNRTMTIVSRTPLSDEEGWEPLAPGEMIVMRRGVFTWSSVHGTALDRPRTPTGSVATESQPPVDTRGGRAQAASEQSRLLGVPRGQTRTRDVLRDGRILTVEHETIYRYDEAVELSTHVFRLHPVHDLGQDVLDYRLEISPPGAARRAEDVFGNQMLQYKIERPYQELWIRARSRVRVRPPEPIAPLKRATLPLVWMPWQRQMMTPYLLPPELPETQLQELSEYAMSFALRNDYDLVETLRDLNLSIYRDFAYQPGATMLETSPFVVYVERRGVCQDFANLFICLCRLLNVPARYRVGYIFTGADYANQIQSEASHAWAEVYLPNVGWRGYDPTNGIMAGLDHVRVAHGRNYRDATPTSGTLFRGGKGERLEAKVRCEVETEAPSDGAFRRG